MVLTITKISHRLKEGYASITKSNVPTDLMSEHTKLQRTRQTRLLVCLFLFLSLLSSVAVVSVRNTYDDEFASLSYVQGSVGEIWRAANSQDVHPPGMYELAHFAYRLTPSPRWMTLWTVLLLQTCLAVYMFSLAPLFCNTTEQICFLLLSCLNPQLLMWGITTRWYGWWTGPALIAAVVALQPRSKELEPSFGYKRALIVALLLATLFYVNYITVVFGVCLLCVMFLRYGVKPWRQFLLSAVLSLILVSPQIHPMLAVHLPGGRGQRTGILPSFVRLTEGVTISEAYLPWHLPAIMALFLFLGLGISGALRIRRLRHEGQLRKVMEEHGGLTSITLLSFLLFAVLALAGFGGKPRSGIVLLPLLAIPISLVIGSLRSFPLRIGVALTLLLWCGLGLEHLLLRQGLAKSSMTNHPEEVTHYVLAHQRAECSVVVTYDVLLAYTFANSHAHHLLLLSTWKSPLPLNIQRFDPKECSEINLYRVTSYLGGLGSHGVQLAHEMDDLQLGTSVRLGFNRDADAAWKRRFKFASDGSALPDDRYVVRVNHLPASALPYIEAHLPDYLPQPAPQ